MTKAKFEMHHDMREVALRLAMRNKDIVKDLGIGLRRLEEIVAELLQMFETTTRSGVILRMIEESLAKPEEFHIPVKEEVACS